MNGFTLRLQDATHAEDVPGVTSFVGEDASGSFGVLPGHARFMTTLVMGLARFSVGTEDWRYLAVPGALLYFHDNVLCLSTRRYLVDDDYARLSTALREQLLREEENLHTLKESLHRMEEEVLQRMWEINRRQSG